MIDKDFNRMTYEDREDYSEALGYMERSETAFFTLGTLLGVVLRTPHATNAGRLLGYMWHEEFLYRTDDNRYALTARGRNSGYFREIDERPGFILLSGKGFLHFLSELIADKVWKD